MSTWTADIGIDLSTAHGVVVGQFPQYSSHPPKKLGEGWDNFCILYPDGIVFRLPRRETAVPLIGVELAVLPQIAPLLSLPIPVPILAGEPTPAFPYPFLGYQMLLGETADRRPFLEPSIAATVLGQTLRVLHGLDPDRLPLPGDHIHRKDPVRLRERFDARWAVLPDSERSRWGDGLAQWVHDTAEHVQPTAAETVVHGDLYPRHLLVHEGKLSGIIDWGDVHLGHPSMDLSVMYTGFDAEHHAGFLAAYGQDVSGGDLELAKLRAAMYGAALLAYGLDVADGAIAECGRTILDRAHG